MTQPVGGEPAPVKRGPGRPRKVAAPAAELEAPKRRRQPPRLAAAAIVGEQGPEPISAELAAAAGPVVVAEADATPAELERPMEPPAGAAMTVVIPTKGRPANITRAIRAWIATHAFDVAIMTVLVERDELDQYGAAIAEAVGPWAESDYTDRIRLIVTGAPGYAHGANWAARGWLETGVTRHLAIHGDDHVPETDGWAHEYVVNLDELVDRFGAGMVYGDDGLRHEKLATEYAVSRSWVATIGRVIPALVGHLYSDDSVLDLAKAAGVARYLPHVVIRHHHPLATLDGAPAAAWDAQYRRVNSDAQRDSDLRIYRRWSARPESSSKAGLVNQCAKLRALRP